MGRTDTSMLDALLRDERLTEDELEAFQGMRKRLPLSSAQRNWVQNKYLQLELDADEPAANLVSSGLVKAECTQVFDFERMPRPLKPPSARRTDAG